MIYIDGAYGEGGGQIIRTALSLSMVTKKPFCITNIRAKRSKSGLLRQHLTAVNAAAKISCAQLSGNFLGSKKLEFFPKEIIPGKYEFAIATAGSSTLVLQTILPAMLSTDKSSELLLGGGTHNPYAPPYDFIEKSFINSLKQIGFSLSTELKTYGFYPAGGGSFTVNIFPKKELKPLNLINRGDIKSISCYGIVSKIPVEIAKKETEIIEENLKIDNKRFFSVDSPGPGNIVFIEICSENTIEIITGFGQRGKSLKKVANEVIFEALQYIDSEVPVGKYLADQLLLPIALTVGGRFRTLKPTQHTLTNIEIIKKFLNLEISCNKINENNYEIDIRR